MTEWQLDTAVSVYLYLLCCRIIFRRHGVFNISGMVSETICEATRNEWVVSVECTPFSPIKRCDTITKTALMITFSCQRCIVGFLRIECAILNREQPPQLAVYRISVAVPSLRTAVSRIGSEGVQADICCRATNQRV